MATQMNHNNKEQMKEFFTKTLYEEPSLVIGTNGPSIIIGQRNNWVVLDKQEVSKIEKHFSSGVLPLDLQDIQCKQIKNKILLTQLGNLVSINKDLLGNNLLK